jgi:hypothetical protein
LTGFTGTLRFDNEFDDFLTLTNMVFPDGLQTLVFGKSFNQPLDEVTLPDSIQEMEFGSSFNQSFEGVHFPTSLQTLKLGYLEPRWEFAHRFPVGWDVKTVHDPSNQPLEGDVLPSSLQTLIFGDYFNQPLDGVVLPDSLQHLEFGWQFDQCLEKVVLPRGLRVLRFSNYVSNFDQPMENVQLPEGLESLEFGHFFNQRLPRSLPSSLKNLVFGAEFDLATRLDRVFLPEGLETIEQQPRYPEPLTKFHLARDEVDEEGLTPLYVEGVPEPLIVARVFLVPSSQPQGLSSP